MQTPLNNIALFFTTYLLFLNVALADTPVYSGSIPIRYQLSTFTNYEVNLYTEALYMTEEKEIEVFRMSLDYGDYLKKRKTLIERQFDTSVKELAKNLILIKDDEVTSIKEKRERIVRQLSDEEIDDLVKKSEDLRLKPFIDFGYSRIEAKNAFIKELIAKGYPKRINETYSSIYKRWLFAEEKKLVEFVQLNLANQYLKLRAKGFINLTHKDGLDLAEKAENFIHNKLLIENDQYPVIMKKLSNFDGAHTIIDSIKVYDSKNSSLDDLSKNAPEIVKEVDEFIIPKLIGVFLNDKAILKQVVGRETMANNYALQGFDKDRLLKEAKIKNVIFGHTKNPNDYIIGKVLKSAANLVGKTKMDRLAVRRDLALFTWNGMRRVVLRLTADDFWTSIENVDYSLPQVVYNTMSEYRDSELTTNRYLSELKDIAVSVVTNYARRVAMGGNSKVNIKTCDVSKYECSVRAYNYLIDKEYGKLKVNYLKNIKSKSADFFEIRLKNNTKYINKEAFDYIFDNKL